MGDRVDAFQAIIDIHETPRLMAITPDLNRSVTLIERRNHLPANGSRSFLASSIPGSERTVHIMKPGDERFHTALRPIFLAEHFRHQLLPTVTSLRHRRVSVGLLQGPYFRILL